MGLDDNRFYNGDRNPLVNLYALSDDTRPSHFTKLRILEFLYFNRNRTTTFGLGFVPTEMLQREFLNMGSSELDFTESLKTLSQYSLVENDTYVTGVVGRSYRITASGRYYINHLSCKFAYLDLVLQDTPIADPHIVTRIYMLMKKTDLEERLSRVEYFLEYLCGEEERERAAIISMSDSVPLRKDLSETLRGEFGRDRKAIRHRVQARRLFPAGTKTPYL